MRPAMPRLGLLASVLMLLAGCGGPTVRLRGVAPMNRNAAGESAPVDVRIYPLRDQGRFQGASFAVLWTDAERILGPDLIAPPTVATVLPGVVGDAPRRIEVAGAASSRWLGLLLLVRQSDGTPRTLVLPTERASEGVIELSGYGLRLVDGAGPAAAPAPVVRTVSSGRMP